MTMRNTHLMSLRRSGLSPFAFGFVMLLFCTLVSGAEGDSGKGPYESDRLIIGISPWTHQALLFKWGKPIIEHVQRYTDKKVAIGSAGDLPSYFKRAKEGSYDVLVSPINFGLHLVREEGFTPLLWARVGYQSVLVCDQASGHKQLKDLNGEAVTFPSPWASTALVMAHAFEEVGVEVKPQYVKSQWEVIESLLGGKTPCAVILSNLYETKSSRLKSRFFEIYRDPIVMDAVLVAPPSTKKVDLEAVKSLATGFDSPGSIVKGFDLVAPASDELQSRFQEMAPILKRFKSVLGNVKEGIK